MCRVVEGATKKAAGYCAAAPSSPFSVYLCFLFVFFVTFPCRGLTNKYSHTELINTGLRYNTAVTRAFQAAHNIPEDIAGPGAPWIVVSS